jgi:hypothetical protein
MYDFHAANQRLHHLLFHASEVSEAEPLEQARAALARFVARGAQAGELTADDPEETASFLLDGLHGLLLRSLHSGRSRRDFTGAAWSLCARLLAITHWVARRPAMGCVVTRGGWFVLCREPHLDGLPRSPLLGLGQRGQHPSVRLGQGWLEHASRP